MPRKTRAFQRKTGHSTPLIRHDLDMSLRAKSLALAVAVAGATLSGFAAPLAHANGADAVIRDLQAEGYLVQINWLTGPRPQILPRCTVVRVNNPSSDEPSPGDNIWVDVTCPNNIS